MNSSEEENIKRCLKTIMDWTMVVPEIKINSSHNKSKRIGRMFALGYHPSMEKGKSVVFYAPSPSDKSFEQCVSLNALHMLIFIWIFY